MYKLRKSDRYSANKSQCREGLEGDQSTLGRMGHFQRACICEEGCQGETTAQTLATWREEGWHQSLETKCYSNPWGHR